MFQHKEWKAKGGFRGGGEMRLKNTPLFAEFFASLVDGEFEEPKIHSLEEWFNKEGKGKE